MTKTIFLDAAGTLFYVRGSVGEVYAKLAKNFGVTVNSKDLNTAFYQSFASANPMTFPGIEAAKIPQLEFEWWLAVSAKAFQIAGVFNQFSDFPKFFAELYAHFATPEPWFVYPDVFPALNKWQQQGIELAVVSNFDSRLYPVLKALNLAEYFTSVTISTEVGAAKPQPEIFTAALQKHNCTAENVWHIGDSFKADYCGAKSAGLKAIWLNREQEKVESGTLPLTETKLEQCSSLDYLTF
ncbi:MAG: HAD-IA family hydrolase [Microcoleus sp. PH2017_29_MFU_D_A]|jgi:putative hydrolase of the HAD superfamily|uniref:HAD-IA family hydrolase n=1 Tax=unclassified Microcoleus TaxID=2642155 RepID=UPI001E0A1E4D|nr:MULTISPECIES: HAD-IA family hydrolase [unclassified Microcoleus]MCC3418015.1 HAD-IA family hydrolase [Microcoleus sp. PH2017_07_MST_O_A]MCC3432752.1 HAD-IA family hydrolase [Microcoleus sp. PH2017_04_SCI_O_A]MCC3440848.1 HAD-IA family hydrolase [Microcoleus sp. PH2017_03_ELD_O_A]MCC3469240.1 HAD-IA family hydrolase [Microcoleus sp. PH2017_06_SFM_O_A]MCC3501896.1 HAD-IA family hydrolase [Microcoleus sp. PH2017_19_SFW_U_A]MCC3507907.1 HAD-IA family hydrolase [Microcoleus sp. PH2017_17_BER_D_